MKTVTVDAVMAWIPCKEYTRELVTALFAGRDTLSARDIAGLDIPSEDKLWSMLRNEFLTDNQMHVLACDFAERVVHLCGADPHPQAAIDAKRAWVRGEITGDELAAARAAAWAAARDAAWDAAWGAAWATAWATAWDAARAAAWATARDAAGAARDAAGAAAWAAGRDDEWAWQIGHVLEVIEEETP